MYRSLGPPAAGALHDCARPVSRARPRPAHGQSGHRAPRSAHMDPDRDAWATAGAKRFVTLRTRDRCARPHARCSCLRNRRRQSRRGRRMGDLQRSLAGCQWRRFV